MPQANDKEIKRQVAIIRSMTPGERRYPKTIDASRKRRIAGGLRSPCVGNQPAAQELSANAEGHEVHE